MVAPLFAALEFERTEIEVQARADERVLIVLFPFRNSGSEPVDILDLSTSCGCLEATVSQRDVPPGDRGVITVRYTAGTNEGLQVQRVTVLTSSDPAKPATLTFRAQLPRSTGVPQPVAATAAVTITPAQLTWLKRPFEMKSVAIDVPGGMRVKGVTARCEPAEGFDCVVRHAAGEARATVEVTPRDSVGNGGAQLVIRIATDSAEPIERSVALRVLARKVAGQ